MATMKDIAKICNASISSVSRVLNNDRTLNISEDLKNLIFRTAKELNYELPKKRNKYKQSYETVVGIIHWYNEKQEVDDPYYEEIRMGIQKLGLESNVRVLLKYKEDNVYDLEDFNSVDGLICIGKFSNREITEFEKISNKIVFVDFSPQEYNFDSVVIDFRAAVEGLLNVIIDRGYKKIGYIGGREFVDKNIALGERRELVFKSYMENHGLFNQNYVKIGTFSSASGYQLMKEALAINDYAEVYFCANDSIAMGALSAIYEKGLKVPEDIKIIGFNDNKSSAFLSPPLTTIHVPKKFMGEQALLSLIEQIEGRQIHLKKVVPTKLIFRQSFK